MLCEHFLAKSFFSLTKKDYGLLIFSNSINIFEKKPIIRTVSMPLKYDIRIWKPYSNGNQLSHLFIWDPKKNCYFVQSKSKNLIQKCAPINTALGVKDCSYESFFVCVPTFAVRETDVSRHNGGTSGAPLKPLRDDSAPLLLQHITQPNLVTGTDLIGRCQQEWLKLQLSYLKLLF